MDTTIFGYKGKPGDKVFSRTNRQENNDNKIIQNLKKSEQQEIFRQKEQFEYFHAQNDPYAIVIQTSYENDNKLKSKADRKSKQKDTGEKTGIFLLHLYSTS